MTYDRVDARKEYVRQARASFQEQEYDRIQRSETDEPSLTHALVFRIVLGILLFLLFVLADMTDYRIFDYSTTTIASEIEKDDYTNAQKYVMMLLADKSK